MHCHEVKHIWGSMFAYLFISSFDDYGTYDSRQRSLWGMAVLVQVGSSNRASYSPGGRILWEQILAGSNFFLWWHSNAKNKSDISYLKTSRAFDVLIHSGKPNSVG